MSTVAGYVPVTLLGPSQGSPRAAPCWSRWIDVAEMIGSWVMGTGTSRRWDSCRVGLPAVAIGVVFCRRAVGVGDDVVDAVPLGNSRALG